MLAALVPFGNNKTKTQNKTKKTRPAQGIIDRQGLSKVRHLDVNLLWLQEQLARDKVDLIKVPGPENNADMMTKHLFAEMIRRHTTRMSLEFREGRSQKAANLQSVASCAQTCQAAGQLWDLRLREQRQQEARETKCLRCAVASPRGMGEMRGSVEEPTTVSGRGFTSRPVDHSLHRVGLREVPPIRIACGRAG